MSGPPGRRWQAGITAIGFLLVIVVVGTIGLAVVKIVPLYLEKMRVGRVLNDVQTSLSTDGSRSQASIYNALQARFLIENLSVPRDQIEITTQGNSYIVRINRESRAPFVADLEFVVVINEQIEIPR